VSICRSSPIARSAAIAALNFRSPAELSAGQDGGRQVVVEVTQGITMNPWFTIARDAARLAIDAQSVVALRMARFCRSTEFDWREAQRMTTEKLEALAQVQVATAFSLMAGKRGPAIAKKAIGIYGKRVRRNRRRLSRR
jgi:hypothetical protein